MEKLNVTICKGDSGYGAWIENLQGIYGEGDTVEATKQSLINGLNLFIKHNKNLPSLLLKEFELEYHLDVLSFLDYYSKIFSKPALEKITGINQKQWFHYVAGRSKPTKKTIQKIDTAFRHFAHEINSIHFLRSV